MLARRCGLTSVEALLDLVKHFFPKEPLTARQSAVIGRFAPGLSDAGAA